MDASTQTSTLLVRQPGKRMRPGTIDFTDHVFICPRECKAAELAPDATDGVLAVHLIDDPTEGTESEVWYLMPLEAGRDRARIFDMIGDSTLGTTVDISKVTCFVE